MTTFEEYARTNVAGVLRFAGVLTRDTHTAEDVVQEVLLRASKRWEQVSQTDAPDAYVRRMVVNEYLSWRRKWARIIPRAEVSSGEVAPDHADALAARDETAARLKVLSARQRTVLVLRYYEGLSDAQIADILGCSNGAVRSAAFRALETLRVTSLEELLTSRKDD